MFVTSFLLAATCLCVPALDGIAQAQSVPSQTQAQAAASGRLRVFLDCECFSTFMREEIEWVDFVRQPQDADVTVLSATNSTGGGGRELVLRFKGAGRLQGVDTELKSVFESNATEDARRKQVLRTMTVGLLWYAERAGTATSLKIGVEGNEQGRSQTAVKDDPWKAWVFSIRGGGSREQQESSTEWDWRTQASADRVTEKWILSFGLHLQTNHQEFTFTDEDEEDSSPLKVSRRERSGNWFVGRALNDHWSAGFEGGVLSSTFGNRQLSVTSSPAIEYNIFPYSEYASRQLRLKYSVGAEHARYEEITLFGKLRETNPVHALDANLAQVQPWGELMVNAGFRQYLQDPGKYRFEAGAELSFRISRGLSLEADGSATRLRDQISLPSRGATPEEILLRLRELESGYQFDFSVSLTYRFGSIFNNIVNPRFGR
jgi:hypothetical protein